MKKYNGVLIDIGGPLRDSALEMYTAENLAFMTHGFYSRSFKNGLDFLTPQQAWQAYGIMSKDGYVGFFNAAIAIGREKMNFDELFNTKGGVKRLKDLINKNIDPSEEEIIESLANRAKNNYMKNQSVRLASEAEAALRKLEIADIKKAIITSVVTPDAIKWVDDMLLSSYFDENLIMGNSPEGATKKDEKNKNIITATERMGLTPEKTIYVGDTRGDMSACQETGTPIAMIKNGMTPPILFPEYLEEMPNFKEGENFFVFNDLNDTVSFVISDHSYEDFRSIKK